MDKKQPKPDNVWQKPEKMPRDPKQSNARVVMVIFVIAIVITALAAWLHMLSSRAN